MKSIKTATIRTAGAKPVKTFFVHNGNAWTLLAISTFPVYTVSGFVRGYDFLEHWMCLGKIDG